MPPKKFVSKFEYLLVFLFFYDGKLNFLGFWTVKTGIFLSLPLTDVLLTTPLFEKNNLHSN